MYIVLGGTGHVGAAVVHNLLRGGQPVTAVTHDATKADGIRRTGAVAAVVNIRDVEGLRKIFKTGERLFLLNPPADPSSDVDVEERANVRAILAALEGSGLKKIVAQSTYGAQPGERLGDLSVLYELELALGRQPIPASIMRAAYLMSNWLGLQKSVKEQGLLPSFFPQGFCLPMVSPGDLGKFGAALLMQPIEETGLHHVEGPERYSPQDVAQAFGQILRKPVAVQTIAPENWKQAYSGLGFSPHAAESYIGMTKATLAGTFPRSTEVEHGVMSLVTYLTEATR